MNAQGQGGAAGSQSVATSGASSAELTELRRRYLPRGLTSSHPLVVDRARGAELWDVEGRRYVDFAGGIGVMNVGHGHPRIRESKLTQHKTLIFINCFPC